MVTSPLQHCANVREWTANYPPHPPFASISVRHPSLASLVELAAPRPMRLRTWLDGPYDALTGEPGGLASTSWSTASRRCTGHLPYASGELNLLLHHYAPADELQENPSMLSTAKPCGSVTRFP